MELEIYQNRGSFSLSKPIIKDYAKDLDHKLLLWVLHQKVLQKFVWNQPLLENWKQPHALLKNRSCDELEAYPLVKSNDSTLEFDHKIISKVENSIVAQKPPPLSHRSGSKTTWAEHDDKIHKRMCTKKWP